MIKPVRFLGGALMGAVLWEGAKRVYQLYKSKKYLGSFPLGHPYQPGVPDSSKRSSITTQDDSFPFGFMETESSGIRPSLKSASIEGDIQGLFFRSVIRQEYRNESRETLEIIYTFPMGWGTALLGMSAEINGKKMEGVVVEKHKAEKQYEKSVQAGDSAVLLQESARGLYTANLGNIKPGESVVIEIHSAKLLRIEQGRTRLCIPTVIGERYGNSHGPGALAPHESAEVDPAVSYPFSLKINLRGDIGRGAVSCPSHNASIRMDGTDQCLSVTLKDGAVLDRDFVLLMEGISDNSMAQLVTSGEEHMVMAAFAPNLPKQPTFPVALKVLVDCSGSMDGDSMSQAQKGLGHLLALLKPEDYISYSCFGSDVRHVDKAMRACSSAALQRLSGLIDATDANMGGTEMEQALVSCFSDITVPSDCETQPVVLLITDGDVWDVENVLRAAKKSNHRIFAIGVGSAPAECLLRDLAEQSGGACELVTEHENMSEALVRMFNRIRVTIAKDIHITWHEQPVWQSTLPKFLYDGETVYCWALFKNAPAAGPVLHWNARGVACSAQAGHLEQSQNADLYRMGKIRQMEECDDKNEKLAIALENQLISAQTSFILTCVREDGDKAEGLPRIQHVPQMPAHGHGCSPCFSHNFVAMSFVGDDEPEIPAFIRKEDTGPTVSFVPTREQAEKILNCWNIGIYNFASVTECLAAILNDEDMNIWKCFVDELQGVTSLNPDQIWAIIIEYLWDTIQSGSMERHAQRLLNHALKGAEPHDIEEVKSRLMLSLVLD